MTLQTQTVRNPLNKDSFTFNRLGSPAERNGGDLSKNYGGLRASTTFFPLPFINSQNIIPLNYIERKDTDSAVVPFTIPDSGFYVVGYDIDYKASVINDFNIEAMILNKENNNEVVNNKIRTLSANKIQTEYFADFSYFSKGDVLELSISFSRGELVLEYASLFAFKIDDEYDDIPITPYIKAMWYMDEINGNRQDRIGNFELTSKNNPGNTTGSLNRAVQFSSSSFQALYNNNLDPISYEDGFTITGDIKLTGTQNSYATLAARWKGNNNTSEDQFILYHDHVVKKFIFAFRQKNNVYKFLQSKNNFNPEEFNKITVTYDKNNQSINLYLNESLQQSLKTIGFAESTNQDFSVGAYNISENEALEHSDCAVDNLWVTCNPISSDGIKILINNGIGLDYEDLLDKESILGLGTGSGNGGTAPSANSADQISFDNNIANLNGSPSNVQDAIERLDAAVDTITSSSFMSYKHTFLISDWVLNNSNNLYEILIPAATHSLPNPCNFQTAKESLGKIIFDTNCIVEVDVSSKDILLKINSNPDARFLGIISMISI